MATSRLPSKPIEHRRNVVEDVTWLTDCGDSPEHVAHRLGYASAESLATVLDRWGEPSLARRLRRPRLGVWAA